MLILDLNPLSASCTLNKVNPPFCKHDDISHTGTQSSWPDSGHLHHGSAAAAELYGHQPTVLLSRGYRQRVRNNTQRGGSTVLQHADFLSAVPTGHMAGAQNRRRGSSHRAGMAGIRQGAVCCTGNAGTAVDRPSIYQAELAEELAHHARHHADHICGVDSADSLRDMPGRYVASRLAPSIKLSRKPSSKAHAQLQWRQSKYRRR